MSIGLVTIAALLLLLPGIAFIAGVNFADKNVREIIFRNTLAEIGYIIIVSIFIHLLFAIVPYVDFNVARLYTDYQNFHGSSEHLSLETARFVVIMSLSYFLAAALAGFLPGYLLGRRVRHGGRWRFFAKHRWMLDLAGMGKENTIYARVLLNLKFPTKDETAEYMIVVEGILRDSYIAADGTLLYLVFRRFTELKIPLATPPYLGALIKTGQREASTEIDQLVIEGRGIVMARYHRLPLGIAEKAENLNKIEEILEKEGQNLL